MKKQPWITLFLVLLLAACSSSTTAAPTTMPTEAAQPTSAAQTGEKKLILATTTSTQDLGLLDYLLPDFEQEFGTKIDVIAVGTGQALQLGEDGNADVLLVHARDKEDAFMDAGHGVRREDVMYNDFVIVGPASDPAGIKGMTSAEEALSRRLQISRHPSSHAVMILAPTPRRTFDLVRRRD